MVQHRGTPWVVPILPLDQHPREPSHCAEVGGQSWLLELKQASPEEVMAAVSKGSVENSFIC